MDRWDIVCHREYKVTLAAEKKWIWLDAILQKLSQTHKDWVVCFVSYEEPTLKKKYVKRKNQKTFWGRPVGGGGTEEIVVGEG